MASEDTGGFHVGQRVLVSNRHGTVRFAGKTEFAAGVWVGIELDEAVGRNDGTVKDVSYFKCQPNYGIFVRPTQVVDASAPVAAPAASQSAKAAPAAASAAAAPVKAASASAKAIVVAPTPAAPAAPTAALAKAPSVAATSPASAAPVAPVSPPPETKAASVAAPPPAAATAAASAAAPAVKSVPATTSSPPAAAAVAASVAAPPAKAVPAAAAAAASAAAPAVKSVPATTSSPPAAAAVAASVAAPPAKAVPDAAALPAVATPSAFAASSPSKFAPPEPGSVRAAAASRQLQSEVKNQEAETKTKLASQEAAQASELQATLAALQKELDDLKTQCHGTREQAEQAEMDLKKAREAAAAAAEARAQSEHEAAELKRKAEDAARDHGALEQERLKLEAESNEMNKDVSTEQVEIPEAPQAGQPVSLRSAVQRLKEELAKETAEKELAELETEEVSLQVEEIKEAIAAAENEDSWTDEVQIAWHKEALWSYYKDHKVEMLRLRQRAVALERAQVLAQQAQPSQEEDVSSLKRSVEQLEHQNKALEITSTGLAKLVEERRYLRQTESDMLEAQSSLENSLKEELQMLEERARQLQAVAVHLCQVRQQIRGQAQARRAEVCRLEIRLQMLHSSTQRGSKIASGRSGGSSLDTKELDLLEVSCESRAHAARAQAWELCLPKQVKEDAELGQSFQAICALYRSLHKACILSRSIHEHFVADAALAMLQDPCTSMRWLCCSSLAASQLAYNVVAVLGRLRALDVTKYSQLANNSALRACADGESSIDAVLDSVLSMLESTGKQQQKTDGAQHASCSQEILSSLRAQGAQLLSLRNSFFKHEPFASWQSACCAVEALRAACAAALYASEDAGGSRRKQWQGLYHRADKLIQNMSAHPGIVIEFDSSVSGAELLTILPSEPQPDQPREESCPEKIETPDQIADQGKLTQVLLDSLLRQVTSLEAFAVREPAEEDDARVLDRVLNLVEADLSTVADLFTGRGALVGEVSAPPWEQARDRARLSLEEAEQGLEPARTEIDRGMQTVTKELESCQERLGQATREVQEVERKFGIARIDAERRNLAHASVARMHKQAKAGEEASRGLELQLEQQTEQCKKAEGDTAESKRRCRELQKRLSDLERLLQKRFSNQVPAEEVLALRRNCARQKRLIVALQHRRAERAMLRPSAKLQCLNIPQEQENDDAPAIGSNEPCWQQLRDMQKRLLLERANPALVRLDEPEPEAAPDAQQSRFNDLGQEAVRLREHVTGLLRSNKASNTSAFDSVALTRFLQATAAAVKQGPVAKVSLPLPVQTGTLRSRIALPVSADELGMRALCDAFVHPVPVASVGL
eukprot:TRINITY_DN20040_c0_g1_i1.p1 TRINITY_DN20040_c0_g1~~TRINITY_DN20040_c0_g1_i1.p1  ORF type:complete len:1338 (+),score=333.29 TRINITY_DN20040_c0_g1_i1:210-4223(+)